MNEVEELKIEDMIYEVRGIQIMLDSDLAKLYQCKNGTKEINQAVKNNLEKFPSRFSWKLSNDESVNLLVKIFDQKIHVDTRGGKYKNPRVFTEQGVAMLATILKGEVAINVSIAIMDAFVVMRKYISKDMLHTNLVHQKLLEHDKRIVLLEETFNQFKSSNNEIYFNGQIYDAYSKIIDIMNLAKNELIIIDSYADKMVLDMISKVKVNVILVTRKNNLLKQIDIDKYNQQYLNLKIIYDKNFHDRYLILDKEVVYHCGSSLNHIGEKTFSVNKIEDQFVIDGLINKIIVHL